MTTHPFDRDRSTPGAHVPQMPAEPRGQRGERDRSDLSLGELSVVLEQIIIEAAGRRHYAHARFRRNLDGNDIEGIDGLEIKLMRRPRPDTLASPAERFQHGDAGAAKAGV